MCCVAVVAVCRWARAFGFTAGVAVGVGMFLGSGARVLVALAVIFGGVIAFGRIIASGGSGGIVTGWGAAFSHGHLEKVAIIRDASRNCKCSAAPFSGS